MVRFRMVLRPLERRPLEGCRLEAIRFIGGPSAWEHSPGARESPRPSQPGQTPLFRATVFPFSVSTVRERVAWFSEPDAPASDEQEATPPTARPRYPNTPDCVHHQIWSRAPPTRHPCTRKQSSSRRFRIPEVKRRGPAVRGWSGCRRSRCTGPTDERCPWHSDTESRRSPLPNNGITNKIRYKNIKLSLCELLFFSIFQLLK